MPISKGDKSRNPKIDEEWPKLYEAIGQAVAEWSRLEHALASAFALMIGVPEEVAEPVFFSACTFSGKHDLLVAGIKARNADQGSDMQTKVFKSACKKADKWASVRNKLAHEKPTVGVLGDRLFVGVVTPNVISSDFGLHSTQCLTLNAIREAAESFEALTQIVLEACAPDAATSLETLLLRVRSLAPNPYSDSLSNHVTSARSASPERGAIEFREVVKFMIFLKHHKSGTSRI